MKLYNIFESIILEEQKQLLTESNVTDDIIKAIDGLYNVWIKYKDAKGGVTDRYIQIYQLGSSLAHNDMISAYQLGGKTAKTKEDNLPVGWKQFRLDRIVDGSIKPTNMKFNKAVSDLPSWIKGSTTDSGKVRDDYQERDNDNMYSITKVVNFNK